MSGADDPKRVEEVVTRICELGCRRVREIIRILAAGQSIPQVAGLTPEEREAVLRELEAIMAVYDGRV